MEVSAVTITHTSGSSEKALHQLAQVLLSSATLEDVLVRAPSAIACVLGATLRCRIDVFQYASMLGNASREWLCVPLRRDGNLLGAIVVEGAPDEAGIDHGLVERVADLLSTAIEARERAGREHAELLEEAAHLKLDVVSMLSHEMRTPLASIKGYATALLLEDADWDSTTHTEFLQIIDEESDRLSRLIEGILESASIDANSLRIELEPVLLPRIARRVVDRIAIQSDVHQFVVMFPPSFPVVEADAERIEQVLTNLIDNAVKYSPEGGLTVVRGEVRPDEVVISVVDQGTALFDRSLFLRS